VALPRHAPGACHGRIEERAITRIARCLQLLQLQRLLLRLDHVGSFLQRPCLGHRGRFLRRLLLLLSQGGGLVGGRRLVCFAPLLDCRNLRVQLGLLFGIALGLVGCLALRLRLRLGRLCLVILFKFDFRL